MQSVKWGALRRAVMVHKLNRHPRLVHPKGVGNRGPGRHLRWPDYSGLAMREVVVGCAILGGGRYAGPFTGPDLHSIDGTESTQIAFAHREGRRAPAGRRGQEGR